MAHDLSRLRMEHPLWVIRPEFSETGSGRGQRWYEATRGATKVKDVTVYGLRAKIEQAEGQGPRSA